MYTNTNQTRQATQPQAQALRPAQSQTVAQALRPAQSQTVAQALRPAQSQTVAQALRPAQSQTVAQASGQPAWLRNYERGDDIGEIYPYIQWVNRGNDLEPSQPIGGFAAPVDQNVPLPNSIYALLHHSDGGSTEVLYTDQLQIAVLRRRFYWFDPSTKVRLPAYREGARGKTQFLCYIKTDDGVFGPVKLTFTGLAGAYFDAARYEFAKAVRRATGGKAPAYAFWMTVVAGQTIMVGKDRRSPITPPTWNGDFDPNRDFIGSLLDAIDWDEVDRWASPKGLKELTADTNGVHEEEYVTEEEEEIPFY